MHGERIWHVMLCCTAKHALGDTHACHLHSAHFSACIMDAWHAGVARYMFRGREAQPLVQLRLTQQGESSCPEVLSPPAVACKWLDDGAHLVDHWTTFPLYLLGIHPSEAKQHMYFVWGAGSITALRLSNKCIYG